MAEKKTEAEATPQAPAGAAATQEPMTKIEAVRQVLAALGNEAKPKEIQEEVKKRFNIDMTSDHIKTAKNNILRKAGIKPAGKKRGRKKGSGKKPATAATAVTAPPPSPTPAPAAKGHRKDAAVDMTDIKTVRDLLDRVGVAHLKNLIDMMHK
jgi:hypothetical protein